MISGSFKIQIFLLHLVFVFIGGCVGATISQKVVTNETVLEPGTSIMVQADWTTIEISYAGKLKRNYTWGGQTVSVELIPRQERWNGSLGLYHPQVRPPHKGVVHMVVEEGQQHFKSAAKAMAWLKSFGLRKPIYRDDGLVIAAHTAGENPNQRFVGISVWQILINGQKPTKIPGSQNQLITTSYNKKIP